jgi:hypothetical protein
MLLIDELVPLVLTVEPPVPPAPTVIVRVPDWEAVPVKYPPAPPPPPLLEPPEPPPATMRYVNVGATKVPNVAFQEFVPVFKICTELAGGTSGLLNALAFPLLKTETPATLSKILLVPIFTIVINVPSGNATDALVGIVIVCAPVLAE